MLINEPYPIEREPVRNRVSLHHLKDGWVVAEYRCGDGILRSAMFRYPDETAAREGRHVEFRCDVPSGLMPRGYYKFREKSQIDPSGR